MKLNTTSAGKLLGSMASAPQGRSGSEHFGRGSKTRMATDDASENGPAVGDDLPEAPVNASDDDGTKQNSKRGKARRMSAETASDADKGTGKAKTKDDAPAEQNAKRGKAKRCSADDAEVAPKSSSAMMQPASAAPTPSTSAPARQFSASPKPKQVVMGPGNMAMDCNTFSRGSSGRRGK